MTRGVAGPAVAGCVPAGLAPPSIDAEAAGGIAPLIGRSPLIREALATVRGIAGSQRAVVISGEPGSGKKLLAHALHAQGPSCQSPFIAVDLAALAPEQVEAELFGGARAPGRLVEADGGSLFLDDLADLPPAVQARLLRWAEQREVDRQTGRPARSGTRVRIIAATASDLQALIRRGRIREDLLRCLDLVPIRLPPLRHRPEDVPLLARHFQACAAVDGLPARRLDAAAMARLQAHAWPGNLRELQNLMHRIARAAPGGTITEAMVAAELEEGRHIPAPPTGAADASLAAAVECHVRRFLSAGGESSMGIHERVMAEIERPLIRLTLAATRGNQCHAARILGLNRNTLRKKIRELEIAVVRGIA